MKIFIGNLSTSAGEKELGNLFLPYGKVSSVSIVYDENTHRSRGCAYVEMDDRASGSSAIERLNNAPFMHESLIVREAEGKGPGAGSHY